MVTASLKIGGAAVLTAAMVAELAAMLAVPVVALQKFFPLTSPAAQLAQDEAGAMRVGKNDANIMATSKNVTLAQNVAGMTSEQVFRLESRLLNIKVNNQYAVQDVKVFGSRTKGNFRPNSDLDIITIISDNFFNTTRFKQIITAIEDDFTRELGFKVNIAVYEKTKIGSMSLFKIEDLLPLK